MLQTIAVRRRGNGADADDASDLSPLTIPDPINYVSGAIEVVVSDDDVRTVHEYLDAVKRGGVKPSNLKCGVLLRMIAEEIGEEKDDLDCLNRQAHYSLLAEEIADQDQVMADEERWREQEMQIAEEILEDEEQQDDVSTMLRMKDELFEEEIAEREEALADEERLREKEMQIAGRILEEMEQDEMLMRADEELIAEEIEAMQEIVADEERREKEILIAEKILLEDEILSHQDNMLIQTRDELIAEEIAAQEELAVAEMQGEEARWQHQMRLVGIAEEVEDAAHDLNHQAHDDLLAEEIAEQEEELADAERQREEARWQYLFGLAEIADDEVLADEACWSKVRQNQKNEENSSRDEGSGIAGYVEQMELDQRQRRRLFRTKRKVEMIGGVSILGSRCTASTMDDECSGQGRARKRARSETRDSLQTTLTRRFEAVAEEARQIESELIQRAQHALDDEVLESLAHQELLDAQNQDEMLADLAAEEEAQQRE